MKLITKRNGKVVGFVTWRNVGKSKHRLVELIRIEVNKKYQNQGIATELFQRMLNKIKFRKLFLTTHQSNLTARNFYKSIGMKSEAVLKNHYYEGEHECVYSMFKK